MDPSAPHTGQPIRGAGPNPTVTAGSGEPVQFPAELYLQMIEHLQGEVPNEGCGLIAFDGDRPVKIYRGTNILASPTRYRMDDEQVIEAIDEIEKNGWQLGAIYHSHPSSPPTPSATDIREANWPQALMVIVSLAGDEPETCAYRIEGERSVEVDVIVESEPQGRLEALRLIARRRFKFWPSFGSEQASSAGAGALASAGSSSGGAPSDLDEPRTTIGILGGMGPAATVDLYDKIVRLTPAERDQDHIPVVIYADPRVPDRTDALLHDGPDPVPWLVRGCERLLEMGADFIVIPCNTAHAFLDEVRKQVDADIVSMIECAADAIVSDHPQARTVGLLATSGTIEAGIYQRALQQRNLNTIVPDSEMQRHNVMPSIRAVKANRIQSSVTARLVEAADSLADRGAHIVLAACTEIPVVLSGDDTSIPLVDATETLARRAVAEALTRDAARGQRRRSKQTTAANSGQG